MTPYILITLLPLVLYIPFEKGFKNTDLAVQNKSKIKYLIFCGAALFLFMALRNPALGSTDTVNYYNNMKKAISADTWGEYYREDYVEKGFQIFVFALSRVFHHPQMLLVVTSAIFVFSICFFIYHNSDDIVFSLVMYISLGLMTFQMQGMRQSLAMSICLVAYEFIKKRKVFPSFLLVLLAMCFHRTAIVFFVMWFVPLITYSWHGITLVSLLSGAAMLFSGKIIDFANDLFDSEYGTAVDNGGFIATAIYVLIIVFAMFFSKKLKHSKSQAICFYMCVIGLVCYLLRYVGALAAERISFYFMFAQLALLPNTLSDMKPQERAMIKMIVYALMIGLFAYRLNGSDFVPYTFYFN